ncbi:MAG: acetamidase/formamidase family protein [Verrucomicrobiota bacterium]
MNYHSPVARLALSLLPFAVVAAVAAEPKFDVYLPATEKTIVTAGYSGATPPALRIKSGQTVKIDTLNSTELNHADFTQVLLDAKISPDTPYIKETLAILAKVRPGQTGFGRMLTGPIYIEDAEPGDTLEVRVIDLTILSDFAINRTISNMGHPLAMITPAPTARVYKLDLAKQKIVFTPNLSLPLWPYLGEMGIAPPEDAGPTVTNFPTKLTGGSFDCPDLGKGATVYFPVQTPGALFHAGGGKATGANGKVNFFGMEVPMTAYLQFILHKGKSLPAVRAETASHYITFGTAAMLDVVMRFSCLEMVDFLKERKGLDFFNAYALGSLAIDFNITRANTNGQLMHTTIPKYIFIKDKPAYWYSGTLPPKYYLAGSYFAPQSQ